MTKVKDKEGERMNAKALSQALCCNDWLSARDGNSETSSIEEEQEDGSSSEDEESFDADEEEFYAATQDPVAALLKSLVESRTSTFTIRGI
jgi:hypothetical protein